jgi:hypothetical protein
MRGGLGFDWILVKDFQGENYAKYVNNLKGHKLAQHEGI